MSSFGFFKMKKTLFPESPGKSDLFKGVSLWMCRFSAYCAFRCLLSQTKNALIYGLRQLIEIRSLEMLASIFNKILTVRIFIWGRNSMNLHSSIMAFCSTHRSSLSPFCGSSLLLPLHLLWKCSSNVTIAAILCNFFARVENTICNLLYSIPCNCGAEKRPLEFLPPIESILNSSVTTHWQYWCFLL